MKNTQLVTPEYQGLSYDFTEDGLFNATKAAAHFGKRPVDWLRLPDTERYITSLCAHHKVRKSHFIKTRRGKNVGGTWFHPKLAVPFARWLNIDFAIWCDDQIDGLIQGTHKHYDWKKLRHESSSSHKVMMEAMRFERECHGKATATYHYINEAKLINWAVTGEFKRVDRDALPTEELDLLAHLEVRNTVLVSRGDDYPTRKAALKVMVSDWKVERIKQLDPPLAQPTENPDK